MIIPVSKLKWELQLIDTLPESSETKKTALALEDEFGGLGTLTLILKSSDSLQNDRLVHRLVSEIKKNPLVSHVQFENDTHFYKENQFLYIRYQDLQDIHTRIKKLKEEKILQENPLWVNLMEADSLKEPTIEEVSFSDIEQKYLAKLKNSFQNDDGTIRVLDIYPTNNISSLSSSRKVYHSIKKIVDQENKDSIEVQYTGQVYHVIKTGKTLLPESQKMGFITAFFIAILLLIHFYKQPQLIIPAAFPISASIFWTLGLAYLLYGRINLFTLLLALIIPGHACQQIIHLLKRYAEERRQGLSPALSLESSILGIGPATAASSFITATTLLSLALMPLSGLQELGILGAIGVILNWLLANTLLPSILILLQRKKPFELFEPKEVFLINRKLTLSHPHPRFLLLFIFLLTIILATRGIIPKFEYDFSQTENLSQEIYVDSLLNETDYPNYDPVIVLFDDPSMSEVFYDAYLEKQKNKKTQTINSVVTYANLLPSQQEKKINKLLEKQAETDPLTGLLNHRKMKSVLDSEISRAERYETPLTMIMIDLDNFKSINDSYGHLKGDELLAAIGKLIRSSIRKNDFAFRYGGEEFLILLPSADMRRTTDVYSRLKESLREHLEIPVSFSAGARQLKGESSDEFISIVDKLLYEAKARGKDRLQISEAAI